MQHLQQHTPLFLCSYSEPDDVEYLSNDFSWLESRAEKLKDEEKKVFYKFIQDLHNMDDNRLRNPMFVKKTLQNYFDKKYVNELTLQKRKPFVRAMLYACVVRELILRHETSESIQNDRRTFLERYSFLRAQDGSNIELTWLKRFERALRYLSDILPSDNNKTIMLVTATLLQGSSVFTQYITGGANRPDTQRRVDIFDALVKYTPRKRAPRGSASSINQSTDSSSSFSVSASEPSTAIKRGRGRPRKIVSTSEPSSRSSSPTLSEEEMEEVDSDFRSVLQNSFGYEIYPQSSASSSSYPIPESIEWMAFDDDLSDFESIEELVVL